MVKTYYNHRWKKHESKPVDNWHRAEDRLKGTLLHIIESILLCASNRICLFRDQQYGILLYLQRSVAGKSFVKFYVYGRIHVYSNYVQLVETITICSPCSGFVYYSLDFVHLWQNTAFGQHTVTMDITPGSFVWEFQNKWQNANGKLKYYITIIL